MGIGNTLADAWLNTLRATSYSEAALWASLHTAASGNTGANEEDDGNYGRESLTLVAPSGAAGSRVSDNNAELRWSNFAASSSVQDVGIWDASTAGNFLISGAITGAPKTVNAADDVVCATGNLDVIVGD